MFPVFCWNPVCCLKHCFGKKNTHTKYCIHTFLHLPRQDMPWQLPFMHSSRCRWHRWSCRWHPKVSVPKKTKTIRSQIDVDTHLVLYGSRSVLCIYIHLYVYIISTSWFDTFLVISNQILWKKPRHQSLPLTVLQVNLIAPVRPAGGSTEGPKGDKEFFPE